MVLRLQKITRSRRYDVLAIGPGNEKDTTRARANALREYLTHSEKRTNLTIKSCMKFSNCVLAAKPVQANARVMDVAALKSEFYTNTKKRTVFHCEIKSLLIMPN
jgi:hypothetical protein